MRYLENGDAKIGEKEMSRKSLGLGLGVWSAGRLGRQLTLSADTAGRLGQGLGLGVWSAGRLGQGLGLGVWSAGRLGRQTCSWCRHCG